MKLSRLLALSLAVSSLAACFDFDRAYCTGGYCDAGSGGGSVDSGSTGGGSGGGEVDAGEPDAGDADAGLPDAGVVEPDAGTPDAGEDAGVDAGCGGAAQLVILPSAQILRDVCSPVVKVQMQDRCGAPVIATADVPLSFTPSSTTMTLYSENTCSSMPLNWVISSGSSELDLHVLDSVPGAPTLQVTSTGLDAGLETLAIDCPSGQRACPDTCVPTAGCCEDAECTAGGLPWVCNSNHVCAPPPCTGFPANCTVYDDRTAAGASRTVTFGSSGYSPKCMRVTTSQDVTFSGTFTLHRLQQTCGPSNRQMTTTSGITKTVRFSDFGTYGYRCADHPAFEQGSVRVP